MFVRSDVCISPMFVPVRCLYQFDVCTSPMFVPVWCLYQSDICTSPTFVLSDVCTGLKSCRGTSTKKVISSSSFKNICLYQSKVFFLPVLRLYQSDVCKVRRLYCPTFVLSDVCKSDVCTSLKFFASLTFVPVWCLYQSDVCTSPTFVLSYVCTVRRL